MIDDVCLSRRGDYSDARIAKGIDTYCFLRTFNLLEKEQDYLFGASLDIRFLSLNRMETNLKGHLSLLFSLYFELKVHRLRALKQ
jgi:hypothetical protein